MLIKAYPGEDIKNNKKLIKDIIKYQKKFPCCKDFPTCIHPSFQTDPQLHRHFPQFETSYFKNLMKYLKDTKSSPQAVEYTILNFKMWAFISKANTKPNQGWHQHSEFKDNTLEIASLLYLTDTKIGTRFDIKDLKICLKPQRNRWFFWPSAWWHCPENLLGAPIAQVETKTRVTIATSIILKT